MYNENIKLFYKKELSPLKKISNSRSPNKPRHFYKWLSYNKLLSNFEIEQDWKPFYRPDFLLAHEREYVSSFFSGKKPLCETNYLQWSKEFADSVRYTNASLYEAIKFSYLNPNYVCFSPTSGFHHASPAQGSGFCTFSGQVIASLKLYNEFNISGAWVDLDQHLGDSIEDSRYFCENLDLAIPTDMNINPVGISTSYIMNLEEKLELLEERLLKNEIQYVVACSGADSLIDDDLGSSCTLEEWVLCKQKVYSLIKRVSEKLQKPIPLTITLFGGYRDRHYTSVLDAHVLDLLECFSILLNKKIKYTSKYVKI